MVFQTLADPTRRRIVEVLNGGERQVNDIVKAVEIPQPGVSRHLRTLNEAGFVHVRADGARRLYSLRPEPFQELHAWVTPYRRLWRAGWIDLVTPSNARSRGLRSQRDRSA